MDRWRKRGSQEGSGPEPEDVAGNTGDGEAFADDTPLVPEDRPRRAARHAAAKPAPAGQQHRTLPQERDEPERAREGYRTSRRSTHSGKQQRREAKAARVRAEVGERAEVVASRLTQALRIVGSSLISLVLVVGLLWGAALGINALARWNAKRLAAAEAARSRTEQARENLLVIGVKDKQATGFAALKAERSGKRVLGIAIPDGAFVEVPGQGYESIGDSYHGGPEVSKDAVSNFLMVPFERYAVVDADVYQRLLTEQDVKTLLSRTLKTDLTAAEKKDLGAFFTSVASKDVWIVPMPVKQISIGTERYYEPQRTEIADLILQWWGVRVDQQRQALRVIVYNGVGTPGVAGKAAQQLIRAGMRVVDSKNADDFNHKATQILLYHGTQADAQLVKDTLGVGQIVVQSAPQTVADIIVIIGADYAPPTS